MTKKHLLLFIGLYLLSAPPVVYAAITYVQGCANSAGATSVTCVMGSSITSGDLLVVASKAQMADSSGTSTPTFSSSAGVSCTWNVATTTIYTPSTNVEDAMAYCIAPSSGTETVQVSWNGAATSFSDVAVAEYSAATGFVSPALDIASSTTSAHTQSSTIALSSQPTYTNDLLIAIGDTWDNAQDTSTAVTGWTIASSSERNTKLWYWQEATTTTVYTWARGITTDYYGAIMGAFEENSQAAAVPRTSILTMDW